MTSKSIASEVQKTRLESQHPRVLITRFKAGEQFDGYLAGEGTTGFRIKLNLDSASDEWFPFSTAKYSFI